MTEGGFVLPSDVAWIVADRADDGGWPGPVVYLAKLPDGPMVVLDAPASVIWVEATDTAPGDVVARVAVRYGISAPLIRAEVESCLSDLAQQGLLETRSTISRDRPGRP